MTKRLVVRGRDVVRSRPLGDGRLYHGGVVRLKTDDEGGVVTAPEHARHADQVFQAIDAGLALIENEAELTISPDAEVQMVDLYDLATHEYIVLWRIACRYIPAVLN